MELLGRDGNIFSIMGTASQLLQMAGMHDQNKEMIDRVTSCRDYDQALHIISEYVETELSAEQPPKKSNKRKVGILMNDKWEIIHGDALKVLREFAPNTFDAVITDPPYASGGRTQAEKNKSTDKKYSSMGESAPPPFDGDSKDQRSWTRWAAEWLYDARKVCKPGAPVCMFIDWRQLPRPADALQWAGWIWRGTAVWDKGNSRPQKGRFRQQAEYVWGSNGDMPISRPVPCLPGVFKYGNPQHRIHLTEKPLQLMRDVVKITEPGGRILDPFAGSGRRGADRRAGGLLCHWHRGHRRLRRPVQGTDRTGAGPECVTACCLPIALDNTPTGGYNETTGGGARMKVEFTFDKEQIQQYGYTVDTVRQTIPEKLCGKRITLRFQWREAVLCGLWRRRRFL